jgi:anaerobic selenocysteine-containing dehydrogenase
MNPDDVDRLRLSEGQVVRVSSGRSDVLLPVKAETAVSPGTVVVPFNQPTVSAGSLIDVASPVTTVQVDPSVSSNAGASAATGDHGTEGGNAHG